MEYKGGGVEVLKMEGGAEGGDLHCQYGQSNVEKYRGLKVQSTKRPRVPSVKGRIQLFFKDFIYL